MDKIFPFNTQGKTPADVAYLEKMAKKPHITLRERVILENALKILEQKGEKVQKNLKDKCFSLIKESDANLTNLIQKIVFLKEGEEFYLSREKKNWKIHILSSQPTVFQRILFRIGKMFSSSTEDLANLTKVASNQIKADLYKKIHENYIDVKHFFFSKKSILAYQKLRSEASIPIQEIEASQLEKTLIAKATSREPIVTQKIIDCFSETVGQTISLNNENCFFNNGGRGIDTTRNEREDVSSFLAEKKGELNDKEIDLLQTYGQAIDRSLETNLILSETELDEIPFSSQYLHEKILSLKVGEEFFCDVGYVDHEMRGVFLRTERGFQVDLFDTSGALDILHTRSPIRMVHWLRTNHGNVAIRMQVQEEIFQQNGKAWLEQILFLNTEKTAKSQKEQGSFLCYANFLRIWKSLEKIQVLHEKQMSQLSATCFASRIDAIQMAHFIKEEHPNLYHKLRYHRYQKRLHDLMYLSRFQMGLSRKNFREMDEWLKNEQNLQPALMEPDEKRKIIAQIGQLEEEPKTPEIWKNIIRLYLDDMARLEKQIS